MPVLLGTNTASLRAQNFLFSGFNMTTLCSCGFDGADFVTQHQIPAGAQFGCPRCDNTVNTGGSAAPEIYPAATVFGGADAATLADTG